MSELELECRSIRERLAQLALGALELPERAPLEEHLARCAACSEELEQLSATRLRLDAWEAPREDWSPRSLARAAVEHARARTRKRRRMSLSAVAASVLAGLAAFGWAQRSLAPAQIEALVDARARAVAEALLAARIEELARGQEARMAALEATQRRDRVALFAALDSARAIDREACADDLAQLGRGLSAEAHETREALLDLVAYVAQRGGP